MVTRRQFILSVPVCLSAGQAAAHIIPGRICDSPTCPMCTHNRAHRAGWPMNHVGHARSLIPPGRECVRILEHHGLITEPETMRSGLSTVVHPRRNRTPVVVAEPEIAATPEKAVEELLNILNPRSGSLLYDLGCGDGRIIEAAARRGCYVVGVDRDPGQIDKAYRRMVRSGISGELWSLRQGDVRDEDPLLKYASWVVMYLYEKLIRELVPKIAEKTTIASVNHTIPGCEQTEYVRGTTSFFVSWGV